MWQPLTSRLRHWGLPSSPWESQAAGLCVQRCPTQERKSAFALFWIRPDYMSLFKIQGQHIHMIYLLLHSFLRPFSSLSCYFGFLVPLGISSKWNWSWRQCTGLGLGTTAGSQAAGTHHSGQVGWEQKVAACGRAAAGDGGERDQAGTSPAWLCLRSHAPQQSHGSWAPPAEIPFSNQTAISFDYSDIIRSFSAEWISFWGCTEPEVLLCLQNNCKTNWLSLVFLENLLNTETCLSQDRAGWRTLHRSLPSVEMKESLGKSVTLSRAALSTGNCREMLRERDGEWRDEKRLLDLSGLPHL